MEQVLLLGPESHSPCPGLPFLSNWGRKCYKTCQERREGGRGRGIVRLYMWPLVSNEGDTGLEHCQARSGLQDVSLLSSSGIITH